MSTKYEVNADNERQSVTNQPLHERQEMESPLGGAIGVGGIISAISSSDVAEAAAAAAAAAAAPSGSLRIYTAVVRAAGERHESRRAPPTVRKALRVRKR